MTCKTGLLIASQPLRNIIGQQCTKFRIQEVLDKSKILICNFAKGIIGEDASALLGSMVLTSIQSSTLFRATYSPEKRIPFYVYVDEMHSFVTLSFADILAESRKYGLSLFLAHQYIEQVDERVRSAIFGNVGTLISFRIGAEDAKCLVKEFHPVFDEIDLVNLPKYSMYLKLMIDGAMSRPFSAMTIQPKPFTRSYKEEMIKTSRKHFATNIHEVLQAQNKKNENNRARQQGLFK